MNRFKNALNFLSIGLGLAFFTCTSSLFAQIETSSDELFLQARKEAFDAKNYSKAIALSKKALEISPKYTDIRVFLGRLYTWTDRPDSARVFLHAVLAENPTHEEALQASFDVEYWNDRFSKALEFAERGAKAYPNGENFAIDVAKTQRALGTPSDALSGIEAFISKNSSSQAIEALRTSLKNELSVYKLGVSYAFNYFDKRFSQPWHLTGLSFGKQYPWGSVNMGLNYAHRFGKGANELELESYPSIAKGFYAYIGAAGAISSVGLFPKYRVGFSLYKSLPHSFELEAGLRHLQFTNNTTIYVTGVGKYVGNSFIHLRSYLTPGNNGLSSSFSLSTKCYLSDQRYDFIGFSLGRGVSPDDQSQVSNLVNRLNTLKAGLDYSKNIRPKTTLAVSASWIYEEYQLDTFGNQFGLSFSFQKRF